MSLKIEMNVIVTLEFHIIRWIMSSTLKTWSFGLKKSYDKSNYVGISYDEISYPAINS